MLKSIDELEDELTRPSPALVADLAADAGDIVVLGAGGKMGPTLCRLARRGLDAAGRGKDRVIAVSRWSDATEADRLSSTGIEIYRADLSDPADLAVLPDASRVIFMVGAKFGASKHPDVAWAVNVALPAAVAQRYPDASIVALSTGNVYPLVSFDSGGSTETDPPAPVGEYAMSCLGRERIFQHAASTRDTRVALIRLNYAVDLRYGVLADVGRAVYEGRPVDVSNGGFNAVWQGYANEVLLRSFAHVSTEPFVINLTGPEMISVPRVAEFFSEAFGRPWTSVGEAGETTFLSDASKCHGLFGYPQVPIRTLIEWQAEWIAAELPMLDKPTKFAVRDGAF